jgi:hypothetical protein
MVVATVALVVVLPVQAQPVVTVLAAAHELFGPVPHAHSHQLVRGISNA